MGQESFNYRHFWARLKIRLIDGCIALHLRPLLIRDAFIETNLNQPWRFPTFILDINCGCSKSRRKNVERNLCLSSGQFVKLAENGIDVRSWCCVTYGGYWRWSSAFQHKEDSSGEKCFWGGSPWRTFLVRKYRSFIRRGMWVFQI